MNSRSIPIKYTLDIAKVLILAASQVWHILKHTASLGVCQPKGYGEIVIVKMPRKLATRRLHVHIDAGKRIPLVVKLLVAMYIAYEPKQLLTLKCGPNFPDF